MTTIDWAIVAFAACWRRSAIARDCSSRRSASAGFAGGAVLGARLAPLLLDGGSASPYAPGGRPVRRHRRGRHRRDPRSRASRWRSAAGPAPGVSTDRLVGGAVAFVALALAIAWVAARSRSTRRRCKGIRADVQQSVILGAVNERPAAIGPDPQRAQPDRPDARCSSGPSADVAAPDRGDPRRPRRRQAAASRWSSVLGTACGLNLSGSGWVAGTGARRHQRPRDRRPGRTPRRHPRRAPSSTRADVSTAGERHRRAQRARACGRAAAAARARGRAREPTRRGARLPRRRRVRERSRHGSARPAR